MTNKQVVNVSKAQSAKVMAAIYFVSALPYALFAQIPSSMPWMREHLLLGFVFMVAALTVLGFVFTIIGAGIYNLIAGWIGGFEFTVVDIEGS